MRRILTATAITLTLWTMAVHADQTARFVQDQFAIGFWVDPPLDKAMDTRYREIAEANFTLIIGGFGVQTPEILKKQMALCEKYHLNIIAHPIGLQPDQYPQNKCCWGYGLRDEPAAKDFPDLAKAMASVHQQHPGKTGYINLFPNYATPEQLGADTYEAYVDQFIREVNPDILSMDHYPRFSPTRDGRDNYCANLDVMRTYSMKYNIPFWNFFNTMPYGPQTDPTEAQLRWQIYASLAYGAKGVLYFCYYTPAGAEFPKGGAIITRDDRKTRHYEEAKRLNRGVKNLGPYLMNMKSLGVYRVKPEDDPAVVLRKTPIRAITGEPHDPKPDYLVGLFRYVDGRFGLLLQNYQFAYSAWPTITFYVDPIWITEVDKETGKERPARDDSPDMEGFQLSLDAGEGRLFLIPAPKDYTP